MMFQPFGITADERREFRAPSLARDVEPVAERLDHQVVAVAAAVQAETQHHRHFQRRRDQPRRQGETRRLAEERRIHAVFHAVHAVGQQRDQCAGLHRLLDLQHQRGPVLPGIDHARGDVRVEFVQQLRHRRVVTLVQHHPDHVIRALPRKHAQDFEAAQVRTQQQHAAALVESAVQIVEAGDGHVEAIHLPAEQEHPVEDGRGEAVDVPSHVPPGRAPPEYARQIGLGIAPLGPAPQQEIRGDRQQAGTRHAASAVTADAVRRPALPHGRIQGRGVRAVAARRAGLGIGGFRRSQKRKRAKEDGNQGRPQNTHSAPFHHGILHDPSFFIGKRHSRRNCSPCWQ